MPELNKANRQVADVDIRILQTMAPFMFFNTANTTTAGLSADNVYAMAKGYRRIAFQNPIEGTMTIEAQVYPFKFFSLLSDGSIKSDSVYAEHQNIVATEAGTITIELPDGASLSNVYVYPAGDYGNDAARIEGSYADGVFTATTASDIAANSSYEVGYMISRTSGVKRIAFNDSAVPPDYYITQKTFDKCEDGTFSQFLMTAYKATIQRSFDLSFTSEGDPASITLTFDLMADSDGNVFDITEI